MVRREKGKQDREREQLLKTLTEKSFAGIYLVQDGRFCFLNDKASSYAGYERDELLGIEADTVVHPEDRTRVKTDARAMLRGERTSPYVFRIITKQGAVRWIMETVSPISYQGRPALLGSSMNITDRMEAEEKLRKSETLYRTIFETTGAATIIVEEDTTVTLVNTEFEKLSGAPKAYWEGKRSWTEFVHEKDLETMIGYHRLRRIDAGAVPRNYEFSLIDREGNVREVLITISMIPGTKRSVASFADISERRKSEERLRESEDRYRTIFETTGTATVIVEEDTTVTLVNTEFEKLSGGSKEYWEGKRSWTEFVCDRDKERMLGYHRLRRIDHRLAPRNYEFGLVDRKGNIRDIIITISMIPGTTKSVASFVDITERKKAEGILKKRERELEEKTHELEEVNAALRVLLKRREEDREELEKRLVSNVGKLVMPYVEKMKKCPLAKREATCLEIIESNLRDVVSPFAHRISSRELNLTPAEFQVAGLVREGKTTKEIADFLHVSPATIEVHRHHIRKKLGLNRIKSNLRVHLLALR